MVDKAEGCLEMTEYSGSTNIYAVLQFMAGLIGFAAGVAGTVTATTFFSIPAILLVVSIFAIFGSFMLYKTEESTGSVRGEIQEIEEREDDSFVKVSGTRYHVIDTYDGDDDLISYKPGLTILGDVYSGNRLKITGCIRGKSNKK